MKKVCIGWAGRPVVKSLCVTDLPYLSAEVAANGGDLSPGHAVVPQSIETPSGARVIVLSLLPKSTRIITPENMPRIVRRAALFLTVPSSRGHFKACSSNRNGHKNERKNRIRNEALACYKQ